MTYRQARLLHVVAWTALAASGTIVPFHHSSLSNARSIACGRNAPLRHDHAAVAPIHSGWHVPHPYCCWVFSPVLSVWPSMT